LVGVEIVEGNERTEIEYEYNENGIRVGKTVDGVETSYLIDELQPYAQVLEEYDASGNLQAAYTYGEDLISRNGQFYHKDGLGSTRLLSDENGEVLESYNYDAYGNLIAGNGSENPYLFAGEQRDSLMGLDYLRARYYDPTLGRFISRDAYQGSLNDPMSQHKYQYAHANPVVNTDPSGYVTFGQIAAAMAIIGTLSSLGYTTGAAIGTLANGGDGYDALSKYDQYFAGFADVLSFGISTKIREKQYGATATRNHRGLLFNLGRFGGALSSFALSVAAPNHLATKAAPNFNPNVWGEVLANSARVFDPITWGARVAQGHVVLGTGLGAYQSTSKIQQGTFTLWDSVVFMPLLTSGGSIAFRHVSRAIPKFYLNNNLVGTKIGGFFSTSTQKIHINPAISPLERLTTIRHESIHAYLGKIGKFGQVGKIRAWLKNWGYTNSGFLKGTEEIIAETYATTSLLKGIKLPFKGAYKLGKDGNVTLTPLRYTLEALSGLSLMTILGATTENALNPETNSENP